MSIKVLKASELQQQIFDAVVKAQAGANAMAQNQNAGYTMHPDAFRQGLEEAIFELVKPLIPNYIVDVTRDPSTGGARVGIRVFPPDMYYEHDIP